ncbi:MAG: amino acid permease [Planctomycetales bacterium]|nr:amino acid permease [Planctomycetales bacterium]
MPTDTDTSRTIGYWGATAVGVGAIVGGGILALAGTALAATGPSALVAFSVNGLIAFLTAASFAEVSSKFPYSGGAYAFSKRVLSVEAAFAVGWIVWFASIVAAVLYAFGFGQFVVIATETLAVTLDRQVPVWLMGRFGIAAIGVAAVLMYSFSLARRTSGSGIWANIGKVIVFSVLIIAGLIALPRRSSADIAQSLQPFFTHNVWGLLQAMGFTFIALQGFDLIAAVAGEIRQPEKNIPRAMFSSLTIALAIYLPLIFVLCTVGVTPGESITTLAQQNPETIVAVAVEQYLGTAGYWLVVVAAILSMLSALEANLYAASRVAMSMALDRTLPQSMGRLTSRQTPSRSIVVTGAIVTTTLLAVPNVAAAGAASSLVFLVTFAIVHWIAILVRLRSQSNPPPFQVPFFPLIPMVGGLACLSLAVYQGVVVPTAGIITVIWLSLGGALFLGLFAGRARVTDESAAAHDPELHQMRGRSPLVLVPMANPRHSRNLIAVADALTPPGIGKVLIMSVVVAPRDWQPDEQPDPLRRVQDALGEGIAAAARSGINASALATVAANPWDEIARTAKSHHCETILLGLQDVADKMVSPELERLLNQVDSDVVLLRAPESWQLSEATRILVPTRGRGDHDPLLARLIGSLQRQHRNEVTFLRVLPDRASVTAERLAVSRVSKSAADIARGSALAKVVRSDDPLRAIVTEAGLNDLLVLGIQRQGRKSKSFGKFTVQVASRVSCPILIISRRN